MTLLGTRKKLYTFKSNHEKGYGVIYDLVHNFLTLKNWLSIKIQSTVGELSVDKSWGYLSMSGKMEFPYTQQGSRMDLNLEYH